MAFIQRWFEQAEYLEFECENHMKDAFKFCCKDNKDRQTLQCKPLSFGTAGMIAYIQQKEALQLMIKQKTNKMLRKLKK